MESSYIKTNEPELYAAFIEYWQFMQKYWKRQETQEWWECFISDLQYYVSELPQAVKTCGFRQMVHQTQDVETHPTIVRS